MLGDSGRMSSGPCMFRAPPQQGPGAAVPAGDAVSPGPDAVSLRGGSHQPGAAEVLGCVGTTGRGAICWGGRRGQGWRAALLCPQHIHMEWAWCEPTLGWNYRMCLRLWVILGCT